MEQQKIGKFIHDLRKEKEMTQKQLADRVGVSDKTISKWETGRGIPDTAIMSELCKVLGISINELLSGERLSVDNYSGKAEENMVNLLKDKEQEKEKQKWSKVNVALNLLWLLLFIFPSFVYFAHNYLSFLLLKREFREKTLANMPKANPSKLPFIYSTILLCTLAFNTKITMLNTIP